MIINNTIAAVILSAILGTGGVAFNIVYQKADAAQTQVNKHLTEDAAVQAKLETKANDTNKQVTEINKKLDDLDVYLREQATRHSR